MRRLLLILSAACLGWAALVAATGGIQWRIAGVALRSREPERALVAGLVLLLVYAFVFRESFSRDTDRVVAVLERRLAGLALGCALGLSLQAVCFGSFTAGRAPSLCHVRQPGRRGQGPPPPPVTPPTPRARAARGGARGAPLDARGA